MKSKSKPEKVVRQIRRKTHRKYSSEEKSVLYLKDCVEKTASQKFADARELVPTSIIAGVRTFSKLERKDSRVILFVKLTLMK